VQVKVHRLPVVDRRSIVLPEGVLERVERHVVTAAAHAGRLRRAGRHLKRGLLLHGPPGTGKTLTAMHLASRMPERTVLLVTGQGMGLVERCTMLARVLQPALVVLEDVDLVAEQRTRQGTGANSILFELLNQMDGLADDADVVFLLTTNRPELLEPALAARPGRVDLAVHVPLPDAACRARLLELYGRGLRLELEDRDGLVARTEGVSPAFIKELLRKAAVLAADEDGSDPIAVRDRHVDEVLRELVVEGGELTQALLGVERSARRSC
jgi:ATP-dependent 26S proteasome regulatory subunit